MRVTIALGHILFVLFQHILIPTDFSPAAYQATQMGLELCKRYDSRLSILHIYPEASRFSPNRKTELPSKIEEMETKMNLLSKEMLNGQASKVENIVVAGNVETVILEFVNKQDFDLVIVGVNSNGYDNHLGSHATSIIEHTETPVLIVPNKSLHVS